MDGIPKRDEIALIVIDIQEKFRPVIFEMGRVIENVSKLIKAFKVFGIPIIHTEQYSKGLAPTVPELAGLLDDRPIEKTEFSPLVVDEFDKPSGLGGLKILSGVLDHRRD